jgi:hypothetical protein
MTGLLSERAIYVQTGILYQHFLTFRKPIYVYRRPNLSPNNNTNLFPYQNEENLFEDVPSAYLMSGIRFFPTDKTNRNAELKTSSSVSKAYIKVLPADADYILAAPVDRITVDNLNYNLQTKDPRVQDFLGLKFYMFDIERSN